MADAPKNAVLKSVLIAGAITTLVTLLRLYGEKQNWDPRYFNKEAGGPGALVGIGWLVVPIGFWLGRVVAKASGRPSMRRGFLITLGAIGVFVAATKVVGLLYPDDFRTMVKWFSIGTWVVALACAFAWPRAFVANLGYAVIARGVVIGVQYVAIGQDWGTHYEAVAPQFGVQPPEVRAQLLMQAQALFWTPATVVVCGLFALLGALTVRKSE